MFRPEGGEGGTPGPPSAGPSSSDDDPDICALIKLYLTAAGYTVESARDGIEALLALGRASFVTGEEDEELEARVLSFGAADYIPKPVRKEAMLLRVGRAVSR